MSGMDVVESTSAGFQKVDVEASMAPTVLLSVPAMDTRPADSLSVPVPAAPRTRRRLTKCVPAVVAATLAPSVMDGVDSLMETTVA
jgi:hypothetical protein